MVRPIDRLSLFHNTVNGINQLVQELVKFRYPDGGFLFTVESTWGPPSLLTNRHRWLYQGIKVTHSHCGGLKGVELHDHASIRLHGSLEKSSDKTILLFLHAYTYMVTFYLTARSMFGINPGATLNEICCEFLQLLHTKF